MISMHDAIKLISDRRGDGVVVLAATWAKGWSQFSNNPSLDFATGVMSKSSSVALGLCLARPERKVILLDGDGGLLMNLGSLVTAAGKAPENLFHFVLNNGVYATTGGQPVPNAEGFSFAGLAKAAGYARAYEFDDLEEFATMADEVMEGKGPVLVSLKTSPDIENVPLSLRKPLPVTRPREAMRGAKQVLGE